MAYEWTTAIVLAVLVESYQVNTQQTEPLVRIITPTVDLCHAYTEAMRTVDTTMIASFGGWYIGFLSGVAQGTGIDFLRYEDTDKLDRLLYGDCLTQPDKPLSVAAEEIARSLIASRQSR